MATTLPQLALDRPRSRAYYVALAVAFLVVILAGFSARYYAALTGPTPPAAVVHLHAAAFGAWFLLVLAQATLVAAGRVDMHRRLGFCAVALAPLAALLGALTAVHGARHGWNPGGAFSSPLAFMALGFVDVTLFSTFAIAGFLYRRRTEVHKRLMMLASVTLLWPAITRLPSFAATRPLEPIELVALFGLLAAFAFAGPLYDFVTRRRLRWFELAGGALLVAGRPIARMLSTSESWQAFARWLT